MSSELEWQTPDSDAPERKTPRRRGRRWLLMFALMTLLVIAGFLFYRLTAPDRTALLALVDRLILTEKRAIAGQDSVLFRSIQIDDPAWLATQFSTIHMVTDDTRVIDVVQRGPDVRATVRWLEDGEPLQRLIFFQWVDGSLLHGPSDPDYWGRIVEIERPWGLLRYHRVDREWVETIGAYITDQLEQLCDQGCPENPPPLTVSIAGDFDIATRRHHVRVPSPRLIGWNEDGAPSQRFWETSQRQLAAQLRPEPIRFAVPDEWVDAMRPLAKDFEAEYSNIKVEIVPFSALPEDVIERFQAIDGAMMMPNPAIISSGLVRDLTPYAQADASFDEGDFYGNVLPGAYWHDRLWALPLSAQLRLIYFDAFFRAAILSPQAYLEQIWRQTEPAASAASSMAQVGESWTVLDESVDGLWARAYTERCEALAAPCRLPLRHADVEAALAWYHTQVAEERNIADVTDMDDEERSFRSLNWLSFPRMPLLWIDRPGFYEHYNQLAPVEVFSFSDMSMPTATPLNLSAGIISQTSQRPLDVWTWLLYLSEQRPVGPTRSIPARKSTADSIDFWATLPSSVQEPILNAFNDGRAVSIGEQGYFEWDALTDLIAGRSDAAELADEMLSEVWFQFTPN